MAEIDENRPPGQQVCERDNHIYIYIYIYIYDGKKREKKRDMVMMMIMMMTLVAITDIHIKLNYVMKMNRNEMNEWKESLNNT